NSPVFQLVGAILLQPGRRFGAGQAACGVRLEGSKHLFFRLFVPLTHGVVFSSLQFTTGVMGTQSTGRSHCRQSTSEEYQRDNAAQNGTGHKYMHISRKDYNTSSGGS